VTVRTATAPALVERIDDPADPRLADYRDLTDSALRRVLEPAGGLFIAEGELVVRRALDAGYRPRSFLMAERWLAGLADSIEAAEQARAEPVPVYLAPESVLTQVTGFDVHRGALASMHRRPLSEPKQVIDGADRIAVLEGMANPTNVGAVFRAAAGLGMDGVLLDPRCADPLYRRALKVSMGASLTLPYGRFDRWPAGLDIVREAGLTVLALTPDPGAQPLDGLDPEVTRRCAVLLGTEGAGLTARSRAAADIEVRIPMANGIDSLNVGSAAAVAFWAVAHAGTSGPR
jgi:tRNA G18 (ribose-2'-O)-methylase SpoU